MECPRGCGNHSYVHGYFGKRKVPRFKCRTCKRTFSPSTLKPCANFNVPTETIYRVLDCLTEGCSIRSTERMTGVHRDTILRLLLRAGTSAADLLDTQLRNVRCQRVQVDEIWTFVFIKQHRLNGVHDHATMGDQYVFVSIDADSKLVINHRVGKRDSVNTYHFVADLSQRLANRVQLTTDGFRPYLMAVEDAFGANVDYAQLVKLYGQEKKRSDDREWYAPVRVVAAIPTPVQGKPDPWKISTSYIERQNLSMRTQIRRFTRLSLGFSKKLDNLKAAVALWFFFYNFRRVHTTLRVTPAMQAGLTDHIWEWPELFARA